MQEYDYYPGRDASPPVRIFGVPALAWLIFGLWVKWPSMNLFMLCIGLVVFYAVLSRLGFTVTVLNQRIFHYLRGRQLQGHPWWYRNYFN